MIAVMRQAAWKREAPLVQVAKDFGVSITCLQRWLSIADVEDGVRPGVTIGEAAEIREIKKRNRLLEQEVEVLKRATAYLSRDILPK